MSPPEPAPKPGWRQRGSALLQTRLFRAAISIGVLALILTRINLHELADEFSQVDKSMLALGVVLFLVTNMACVFKWRLVVEAQGQRAGGRPVSYFYLTSLFYIGLFFNNFLPTNFGGDIIKIVKLAKVTGQRAKAAGSVAIDRVSSTFALLMIAVVPALIELRLLGTTLTLMVLGMFLVSLLVIGLFASERTAKRLSRFPVLRTDPLGVRRHLKSFYYALHEFRRKPGTLAAVLAVALVYQVLHVLSIWVLAVALGIDVSLLYYFLFIPVVMAVGTIPVSLNGIGIREGAWVLLFQQVGVATEQALAMSLLSFGVLTATSLAGGVFYLFDRGIPASGGETENG
ncbi:MAG: lysylphosphatidylglycerol synthase transmembrane domain-containing protein [Thermoleophilia bacterium]